MPILGQNLSLELVIKTRSKLLEFITESVKLQSIFPDTKFELRRIPYTGDYELIGKDRTGWFPIAKFGILPMPGCHKIAIFHRVSTEGRLRHKGVGGELLRLRILAAEAIGYRIILCTTRSTNAAEIKLLEINGFVKSSWYYEDGKLIYLWERVIF